MNISIRRQLRYLFGVIWALSTCCAVNAHAESPWKTLPASAPLPTAVQSGYAPVNGIRMYYAIYGQGQPVILLHGGLANSNYWGNLVPFLVKHHFQVIVADSRGHGRSTRSAQPYSYDLMSSDTLALMDYLKVPKASQVGWSDGAIIGLDIAIHHPERINRLFAYGANVDPSGLIANSDQSPTVQAFMRRAEVEYKQLSPTPNQFDAFVEQIGSMWNSEPHFTAAQLHSIRVPTTIADGQYEEGIQRSHTEYIARTIPGADLVILPNVSHFAVLQNPTEFDAAVLKALTTHAP